MFRAIRPTSTLYRASALYKNAAVSSPARASMAMNFARMYSAGAGLARSDVEKRVLDILAGFNKVDAKKISLKANFNADLGLDSLDTVEVVMAIEEEFSIEIPDKDADEIKSAEQAVEYISKRDDAH
ncbi:Acyl carrier protein, mitochondrial [Podila minutissima]|nr:Acyl carrier protein, mitochondrial [Podila minutissima]